MQGTSYKGLLLRLLKQIHGVSMVEHYIDKNGKHCVKGGEDLKGSQSYADSAVWNCWLCSVCLLVSGLEVLRLQAVLTFFKRPFPKGKCRAGKYRLIRSQSPRAPITYPLFKFKR